MAVKTDWFWAVEENNTIHWCEHTGRCEIYGSREAARDAAGRLRRQGRACKVNKVEIQDYVANGEVK